MHIGAIEDGKCNHSDVAALISENYKNIDSDRAAEKIDAINVTKKPQPNKKTRAC